jgi:septum formation protein
VALGDELFGKPSDQADATRMLGRLAGRTHTVWTAVAVTDGERERVELCRSLVTFRALAPEEIAAYWRTGEPADKAGAYGIQGRGAQFIADLRGSYSGVVGLPLFETARLLTLFGCTLLPSP